VVWGSTYLAIRVGLETIPPLLLQSAGFLVAGALILIGLTLSRRIELDLRRDARVLPAIVTGICLVGIGAGGSAWGEQYVASGTTAIVIATVPLWIALVGRLFLGTTLSRLTWIALAAGFIGLLIVVLGGNRLQFSHIVGLGVITLAAIGWSIGSVYAQRSVMPANPLLAAAIQMVAGGIVLAAVGVTIGELRNIHPAAISLRSIAALAYIAVVCLMCGFSLYVWLLKSAPITTVSTYAYANPVVAVFLGWAYLGERVTTQTLVGGSIILVAIAIIVSKRDGIERTTGG